MPVDDLLDELTIDDLGEDQQALAELVGMDIYVDILREFSGCPLWIPKADEITKKIRDNKIQREYNGINIRHLALKYKLSTTQIKRIIHKFRE